MCVYIIEYMRPHLVVWALYNMGRVKCQPFQKNGHLNREAGAFVISTVKESLHST